jgi:hypothetical protein
MLADVDPGKDPVSRTELVAGGGIMLGFVRRDVPPGLPSRRRRWLPSQTTEGRRRKNASCRLLMTQESKLPFVDEEIPI